MKSIPLVRACSLTLIFTTATGILGLPNAYAQDPPEAPPDEAGSVEPAPAPATPSEATQDPPPGQAGVAVDPAAPAEGPLPATTAEAATATVAPENTPIAAPGYTQATTEVPDTPPAALPEAAPAAQLPLSVGGSFWSRYEVRSGYADHGLSHPRLHREGDYLVSRARLTLKTTPVDVGDGLLVSAVIAPQAAYTMGETGAPVTIGDHPQLVLYEGFASVGGKSARFDAGRFMLDYGDALVIGNLGWNEAARSFNGARLHLTPGGSAYYVDLLATLISEGRSVTQDPIQGDLYFWGAYAGLGPAIAEGLELDAYLLGQSTARNENVSLTDPMDSTVSITGEREPTTDLTLGSRLKGQASLLDYRLEAGIQFGKSPINPSFADSDPEAVDKLAYHADAELGVTPTAGVRLALEGLYASGNDLDTPDKDEGWNALYPTAHKFLGFADIIGDRSNIMSAVFHVSYAATKPLKLMLDAHYFSRPRAGADGKEGSVGAEIDTNVVYAFGGGASVRGMYAIFLPNEDFWETKSTSVDVAGDPLHYFELQFGYDFK